jgi:hypothetical protein
MHKKVLDTVLGAIAASVTAAFGGTLVLHYMQFKTRQELHDAYPEWYSQVRIWNVPAVWQVGYDKK